MTIAEIEAVIKKYNEEHPNGMIKPPVVDAGRDDRVLDIRRRQSLMDALKTKVRAIGKQ